MKSKGTILTVDWDFFVPENPLWDMGHNESLLFLKVLWAMRMHLANDMKTNGHESGFWAWVMSWADVRRAKLTASDSHAYAFPVAHNAQRVILVDAHHDCWPVKGDGVGCHDWGRAWLDRDPTREIIWIHPDDDYHDNYPLPKEVIGRVKEVPYKAAVMPEVKVDAVHVCRSGCWTPPWLDGAFNDFLDEIERRVGLGPVELLQTDDWDPTQPRWTDKEFGWFMKQHEEQQKAIEEFTNRR